MPDWVQDVAVSDGYAYVTIANENTLKIVDIDPPESASIINSVPVPFCPEGVAVSNGYAYVADYNSMPYDSGLVIIDINPPELASNREDGSYGR